jgi:DNA repair protein RadC
LKPSEKDLDLTDRLIQVGIIVDTPVIDHLIISEKSYLSMEDNGHMEVLRESTKHVPTYAIVDAVKKQAALIAKRTQAIDIAKKLKRLGTADATIADVTVMPIEEVQALRVRKKK